MLIICDTSPITNLIQVGQLDTLEKLFEKGTVPQKVYQELAVYENQKEEIEKRDWIVVKTVHKYEKVLALKDVLDLGEAEAIVLAKEMNADFLIIDERKGRKIAQGLGINIIGLLGVLIQGKNKGHIEYLKPILDKLIYEVGFRVKEELYLKVLEEVGEA